MASIWELFVSIKGDPSSYKKAVQEAQAATTALEGTMEASASRMAAIGSRLLGGIGFAAIGAGALAAASKFEEAGVQIQRSTGATGEKLKGLEDSFVNVYKRTAASSDSVVTTLTLLSTRTQATGKDLEDLTLKTIKLAKTQREDVAAIVPLVTRAFGDWGIAANMQGKAMDYLRVTSQQTGTSVAKLAETVVYAGAPFRQLGYDFQTATSLIGKFEKEGVNTELVIGGMKAALQKFAKDGVVDTAAAWQDFVAKVQSGKLTLTDVLKEVGAKRGVDLYKAIQEGRFEVDALVKSTGKLASESAPNVETLKTSFTKLQHQVESLVVAHKDLIVIVGLTYPAWSGLASMGGAAISGLIMRLIGSGGATAAIATLSSSTLALGGTFTATGSTIAAAGATATAGWAALLPVLAAAAAAVALIVYTSTNAKGATSKPTYSVTPPKGVGMTGQESWAQNIHAALSPGNVTPPVAPPATVIGGGEPAKLHFADLSQMVSAEALDRIDAKFKAMVGTLAEWNVEGRKIEAVSSAISKVLDTQANVTLPSVAQSVNLSAVTFDEALNPAIKQAEANMHALGLRSVRELRAQYDEARRSTEALILQGAAMADINAEAGVMAERYRALSERLGNWDHNAKVATKSGVNFAQQVSTALNDLGKSFTSVLFKEKEIGDAVKDLGKTFLRIIIEDIIGNGISKLIGALSGLMTHLGSVGKALGGLLGAGGSAASSAGGTVASTAGSAGSAGASAAGSVMGTIGAVSAAVGAVSSIVGNFQFAGMNKSLDLIVKHTLQCANDLANFRRDAWDQTNGLRAIQNMIYDRMGDMWATMRDGGTGGSGKGGVTFSNCTFNGADKQQVFDAAFGAAQLAGAL